MIGNKTTTEMIIFGVFHLANKKFNKKIIR